MALRKLGWVVLLLGVASCRSQSMDWTTLEREGRSVKELPALATFNAEHYWTEGTAQLQVVEARTTFASGNRLTVTLTGANGHATPFILDTGAIATSLSTSAPLMQEALASKFARYRVLQGQTGEGYMGQVPLLRMGSMELRDVLVALEEQAHSLAKPSNVLGIRHLWHTQLEHRGGSWTICTPENAQPAIEAGWDHVALIEGYPLVVVRNPEGRTAYALIDTGAPTSHAIRPFPEGEYVLPTVDGRPALRIRASDSIDWQGLQIDGMRIELLIGMDALASRDWRMTFASQAWIFAPGR